MKNAILILLAFIFLTGCTRKNNKDNFFHLNLPLGIETLEPVMSNSPQTIWGLMPCMEGLVSFDRQNQIIPQVAKKWEISKDGLIYTFTLKTNIFFHNDECFPNGKGRNVTAKDFKYCFERLNDPSTKTRGLWLLRDKIKGTQEYVDYKTGKSNKEIKNISGISALNDSTLQIELYKPFAPFLSLLTMTYAFVYPYEAVDYYGQRFGQHPVGTGPFRFSKWDLDKELIFVKNENYYEKDSLGNRLPYLDGIKFTFTQSSETEFLDFINGKYDYHEPSSETFDFLVDEDGNLINPGNKNYHIVKQNWLNTVYLIMMQSPDFPGGKNSPFIGNKKLRQALNLAIDKEKIVRYVLKNRGYPAENGPLPVGMPGYDSTIKGYTYDIRKAKQLLSEAGYPDGKGLDLTLVISNDETQKSLSIAIQEQLKEVGINLKLEQILQATLNTKQQDGELTFTRGNWGADYFDPENFMSLFYSKNVIPFGPNKTGYSNPLIDELYEKSILITDFNERKKIYDEMQKIVIDDAAWIYLYYNQKVYLLQNNISGFYLDGLNNVNFKFTKKS
jgi:oligopeptide transport system substrate-binding protein